MKIVRNPKPRWLWAVPVMLVLSLGAWLYATPAQDQRTVPHRIDVRHPGISGNKPQSYTLFQALDHRGHPIGYSMEMDSVVCADTFCKVVEVTMTWDALGVYRSYAVADGSILEKARIDKGKPSRTKQDWAAFTPADHKKLHQVLRDSASVLRTQPLAGLTGYRNKSKVDGMTGATPATLKEAVIEGAALSSYHLWHWANGGVVDAAKKLTHAHCSEELLRTYLDREESHYVLFALEHLRQHKLFNPSLMSAVTEAMRSGDHDRIDLGMAYLRSAIPDQDAFHDKLAGLFVDSNPNGRKVLLGLLDAETQIAGSHLDKMSTGLKDTKTFYELHLFLNLVEKHKHGSKQMLAEASRFLESENFFIARRVFQYLKKQSLDEPLARRIKAFQEQSEKEGRVL